jgi:hypothetical protein
VRYQNINPAGIDPCAQPLLRGCAFAVVAREPQIIRGRKESRRSIDWRVRISESSQDLLRAIRQDFGRFLKRDVTGQQRALGQDGERN